MRTKTLLFAALTLAAGLATSMAQSNVYSLNVVGYVNKVYPASGFSMISNPLNTTNNTVAGVVKGAPAGTIFYKFSGGFIASSYDGSTWSSPGDTFAPGEGAFLFVPAGTPYTNTYVGEVMQGSLTNPVPQGFALLGSMVPQAGLLSTDLGFPAQPAGSIVYNWAPGFNANSFDGSSWSTEPNMAVAEGFFSFKPAGGATNWIRNFTVQ